MTHLGIFLLIAAWALSSGGCAARPAPRPTSADSRRDQHWLHEESLRSLMIDMDRTAKSDWPQEFESDLADRKLRDDPRMVDAARHAQALADAARRISATVAPTRMPEVDRRSFNAQAETLHDQALRLQNAARLADPQAMRAALADIDATCRSCHTRFRDVSGPVGNR